MKGTANEEGEHRIEELFGDADRDGILVQVIYQSNQQGWADSNY